MLSFSRFCLDRSIDQLLLLLVLLVLVLLLVLLAVLAVLLAVLAVLAVLVLLLLVLVVVLLRLGVLQDVPLDDGPARVLQHLLPVLEPGLVGLLLVPAQLDLADGVAAADQIVVADLEGKNKKKIVYIRNCLLLLGSLMCTTVHLL